MKYSKIEKQIDEDLKMDIYNLQEEWSNQANKFMHYAGLAAKYRDKRDNLKREISKKVLKKKGEMSEAALNRIVDRNPKVLKFRYLRDIYKSATQAFEQRKRGLEHEQELLVKGFFADPKPKKRGKGK